MGLFKKNLPEKTTIENFTYVPHLELVLFWFLQNDKKIQIINSRAILFLFEEGIRPKCDENNDPDIFVRKVNADVARPIERWLVLKIWLDLALAKKEAENVHIDLKEAFKKRLDYIEKQTEKTLIISGEIAYKYGFDAAILNLNMETTLSKIKTDKEVEDFKYNYLADTIISSEVRLLAWIYKELFNEAYQIKK
jgi:hypothetical protein